MKKFLSILSVLLLLVVVGCVDEKDPEDEVITELNTDLTDALTIDFDYESKSFIDDGVGSVTLERCVDGDTAIFREGSITFSVRFLGINTPESTFRFDAWGKPASNFTCDKLENASELVLESDDGSTREDGNGRYLAWVWYDGRLLNLEIVEEAYSGAKGLSGLKYEMVFYEAQTKAQATDKRLWGELDETFDYSLDGVQITIEELVTNQSEYIGKKVVITGTISASIGGHPYIQQGDYGVYLYKGYDYTSKLEVGNVVRISSLTPTYYPDAETGALQVSGFERTNADVIITGREVEPLVITISELTDNNIGSYLQINDLTITYVHANSYDDAFTVYAEDSLGNEISIRRSDAVGDDSLNETLFEVGAKLSITAPLSRYNGDYQMMIGSIEQVDFE